MLNRRSVLKAGAGLAVGSGLAATAISVAASRARAAQDGTVLCDVAGDSALAQGLGSGDLGIPYHRADSGTWGYVFGDSWPGLQQSGTYLGSPVMLTQNAFDSSGSNPISFDGALPSNGHAAQLFSYNHNADNGYGYEVSRIPNDCIEFGGRTYIAYTSVNSWGSGDGSLMAGIAYSDDYGVTWQDYPYHWAGNAQGTSQSLYMMWSFAGIDPDGWLYIFSKRWNGSHTNGGDGGAIQLFRIQPSDFRAGNFGAQQNWAYLNGTWQWTQSAAPSVILSGNNIGEFSVKLIGSTYCMSYFDVDAYAIRTRTAPRPDQVWTAPKTQITGNATAGLPQVPNLYGGYIHPGSASATSLTLIVSQWDGTVGSAPYWVRQYDGINP
ncbi:MAG: DUF4185 domain-containing protein [Nocardiopsaceae bacterium]|nr:DUF4185 domain-containing protein [Nocardiopsaceae bacterium]